ncbi:MAG: tyrosine-type recombinase/integrase [Bacillota bacterium]
MAIYQRQVVNKKRADGLRTGKAGVVYDVYIKYKIQGTYKTYAKRGFLNRREASVHEAEMKLKFARSGESFAIQVNSKRSVSEYLTEWLESYARNNLRPTTYAAYKHNVFRYAIPAIGAIKLTHLNAQKLDTLYNNLRDKGLAINTIKYIHRTLSIALEHAKSYQYIPFNPARDVLTKFNATPNIPAPYTIQQMKALIELVKETYWEMIIILGGLYGLRRNEILALTWNDICMDKQCFEVNKQLAPGCDRKQITTAPLKQDANNGVRKRIILPITKQVLPFFEQQFIQYCLNKESLGDSYYDNNLVVCRKNGVAFNPPVISSDFKPLLQSLQMPHIRLHDLRHSAATNMHELSGDFFTVGSILGHSLKSLGLYTGLSDGATGQYISVRLERKRKVLEQYHEAVLGTSQSNTYDY